MERARLRSCTKRVPSNCSAPASAEGTRSVTVASSTIAICRRALAALYSCTWCRRPPSRNEMPSMKSRLATIAPAIDALTSSNIPMRSAVSAMTSSVRLPRLAFRRPPMLSPVLAATDSVALLRSAASGTMAATERTKSRVCACGAACCATITAGARMRSHRIGLCRSSCRIRFTRSALSRAPGSQARFSRRRAARAPTLASRAARRRSRQG